MEQFNEAQPANETESPIEETLEINEANAKLLEDNLKKIEENHNEIIEKVTNISPETAPDLLKQAENLAEELEFIQQDNLDNEYVKLMQKKLQITIDVIKMNS